MLSEDEKNDIFNNIQNDLGYVFAYFKNQHMWLKQSKKKLMMYEVKLGKSNNYDLSIKYQQEINYYNQEIENHLEIISIISDYHKSYILEKLENTNNEDFKNFIKISINFIPDNKQKIVASELYYIFKKKYNSDISFTNFNTLMKQLKVKNSCGNVLIFHGLIMK